MLDKPHILSLNPTRLINSKKKRAIMLDPLYKDLGQILDLQLVWIRQNGRLEEAFVQSNNHARIQRGGGGPGPPT